MALVLSYKCYTFCTKHYILFLHLRVTSVLLSFYLRYLLNNGRYKEAKEILRKVAKSNNQPELTGEIAEVKIAKGFISILKKVLLNS